MSAHKIMDDDGNLTDRDTPLRYLKIGDRVTHTEERPNEIATVVRSAGDHIVIQWAEGLSYGALPKYLRTVTVDPKPATYALDDVMEAFGITREELEPYDLHHQNQEYDLEQALEIVRIWTNRNNN